MKKFLSIATAALVLAMFAAGCSDGARIDELSPDIVATGATITKAELISGLWDDESEPSQDVMCVLGSTFTVKSDNPFTIAKNSDPTDYNMADVIVISPVNIIFDETTGDGRGASCPEGNVQYAVQSSDATPLDIEVATSLKARHSLVHMVSGSHTEYPGCTIRAHFDRAGEEICDASAADDEDAASAEDDSAEDDSSADDESAEDDSSDDDSSDDDSADDDSSDDDDVFVFPGIIHPLSLKAVKLSDDGVPCGDQDIHSVKIVVDDYNCQLNGYTTPIIR